MRMNYLSHKNAFTLVELLTVVAIIAVLVALALPQVTKMQEGGRKSKCASNLKQLGAAVRLYMADNDGNIFVPSPISTVLFAGKAGQSGTPATDPKRFLNPYLGVTSSTREVPLARCPADKGMSGVALQYNSAGTSYMFNYRPPNDTTKATLRNLPVGTSSFKLMNVSQPSKTLMIMCQPAMNYVGGGDRRQRWHSGPTDDVYVNACYVDGHVQFVRIPRPGESGYPDTADFTWGIQ